MSANPGPLDHVVVVGASLAGLRACETLRTDGFAGRITLVGAEDEVPYDRPPLSKKLLAGEWDGDRIRLRKPEAFDELGLELRLGVRATGLDTERRTIALADGGEVPYDGLVIATGAAPRRLPGQPALDGICELRTLADALDLRVAPRRRRRGSPSSGPASSGSRSPRPPARRAAWSPCSRVRRRR